MVRRRGRIITMWATPFWKILNDKISGENEKALSIPVS